MRIVAATRLLVTYNRQMIALFGDESYDDHTYVLGGWLITPTHYQVLEEYWRKMLSTLKLPNGDACPGFHASEIMSQSGIYKGWGKDEAFNAFDQATAVLADRPGRFAASPCAVATQIPTVLPKSERDVIWKALFMRFFALVLETNPAAKSIEFVFDRKPEIEKYAKSTYATVAAAFGTRFPKTFHKDMTFVNDEQAVPVQVSDLLMFEWRKRITYRQTTPERDKRPWFPKIRSARPDGALVRYDIGSEMEELRSITDGVERARRMLTGPVIGLD
jgi:hypothetical protein